MRIRAWRDYREKTHWDHECERFYCGEHRLLYRSCGDLVEQNDCPLCTMQAVRRELEKAFEAKAAREVK